MEDLIKQGYLVSFVEQNISEDQAPFHGNQTLGDWEHPGVLTTGGKSSSTQ